MVGQPVRKLFVEGGGDNNEALKSECRRGFSMLLEKAGFKGRMPRIIACGGRSNAYRQFCTALDKGGPDDVSVLLVDAEAAIAVGASPWDHVKTRKGDGWNKPEGASDDDLHFMVECMENWFLADKKALAEFFGSGFKSNSLPKKSNVEQLSKSDVYVGLENASKGTSKGKYGKGAHSFKILAAVEPAKIRASAPFAERLFQHLDLVLGR